MWILMDYYRFRYYIFFIIFYLLDFFITGFLKENESNLWFQTVDYIKVQNIIDRYPN